MFTKNTIVIKRKTIFIHTLGMYMVVNTKHNKTVLLRKLTADDFDRLHLYLQNLSNESKRRFGPHPFDKESIISFYSTGSGNTGYLAECLETKAIVAYAIIKTGYIPHDAYRFQSYGITLNNDTDCTFAPSVADEWQSCGVGNAMFTFILEDLKDTTINRMILWGGVQASNIRAVNYYTKYGFKKTGSFHDNNGENYDMYFSIK